MKTLTITIDVEPDAYPGSWNTSSPVTFDGVFRGLERISGIAQQFGAPVTYFVQPVVLYNDECVAYIKSLHGEIGTHLHGEYIGPDMKYKGPDFSGCDPGEKQMDYAPDVEMKKMRNITNLFVDCFGFAPSSFRAGRFGAGEHTFKCLKNLNYSHDSSIVPRHKHFKNVDNRTPYVLSNGVIEVPITVDRKKRWLRPTPGYSDVKSLKKVLRSFVSYDANVCCMFHNVEVVPGLSPYCSTEKECQKMLYRFAKMIELSKNLGYRPIRVNQVKLK